MDRRRWIVALIISTALHCYLGREIANMPPPIPKHGQPGGDSETGDKDGQGGKSGIKVKVGQFRGEDGEIVQASPIGKDGLPCYEYYGGIGIYNNGLGDVTQVIPGYPAARLGLRSGDHINEIDQIIGEIGTPVTFSYIRDRVIQTVTVKREKICTRR